MGAVVNARRHPAEVLLGRLADAVERWYDKFTPEERDEISHIIHALDQIVGGAR